MKKIIIFGLSILIILNISVYGRNPDNDFKLVNKTRENVQLMLEQSRKDFAKNPKDLDSQVCIVTALALLNKDQELLDEYRSLRLKLDGTKKEEIDGLILALRTGQLEEINLSFNNKANISKGGNLTMKTRIFYPKNNFLSDLPNAKEKKISGLNLKALQLSGKNENKKAIATVKKALKIKENAMSYLILGYALRAMNRDSEAALNLEKGLAMPGGEFATANYYALLAKIYIDDGNGNNALSVLQQGLEANPDDLQLLTYLGMVYWGIGDAENFCKLCEKIKTIDPVIFIFFEDNYNSAKKEGKA